MNKTITKSNPVDEIINRYKSNNEQDITDEARAIIVYIESKITPISIKEGKAKEKLQFFAKIHKIEIVFKAIDESANRYLFNKDDDLYKDSIINFLSKIGGILHNWGKYNA